MFRIVCKPNLSGRLAADLLGRIKDGVKNLDQAHLGSENKIMSKTHLTKGADHVKSHASMHAFLSGVQKVVAANRVVDNGKEKGNKKQQMRRVASRSHSSTC